MAIRSMTGYAQVKGQAGQESAPVNFSLSLKAVNHRFLDLNMRLPAESDALEMKLRRVISRAHLEKITSKLQELIGSIADPARILQEAAILAERSDVQEEIVRMKAHVGHFLGLMKAEGEIGKKLDFLLQEMNREANTLLSKTAGLAGEGLRITEL